MEGEVEIVQFARRTLGVNPRSFVVLCNTNQSTVRILTNREQEEMKKIRLTKIFTHKDSISSEVGA